jgi:excisionase family DNA binding protein
VLTPLLSAKDVAQYLGVKTKTVHEYVRRGELSHIELSSKEKRFTEEHVQEFISKKTKPAKKQIDKKSSGFVTYPRKEAKQSVKDSGTSLTEEIRKLCQ